MNVYISLVSLPYKLDLVKYNAWQPNNPPSIGYIIDRTFYNGLEPRILGSLNYEYNDYEQVNPPSLLIYKDSIQPLEQGTVIVGLDMYKVPN